MAGMVKKRRRELMIPLLFLISLLLGSVTPANGETFSLDEAWHTLTVKSYVKKAAAIEVIAAHHPAEMATVFSVMLQGELYYSKSDKKLYHLQESNEQYQFLSLFDDEVVTQERKRGFKKVKVNNKLRTLIRQHLAVLQLKYPDPRVRLNAINELVKNIDSDSVELIQSLIVQEEDSGVKSVMQLLLAINMLSDSSSKQQRAAITTLKQSLNPVALNALNSYQPPNRQLEEAAQQAIQSINSKKKRYAIVETIFFGLSLGSVLALAAIGLAITFGVMGVINMAHGELIMIGAYTTFVVQTLMPNNIGASIIVAIPAAFIVAGLVGIAIERGVIRHLYGRPLETLLATFGISLILQQAVRSIFSPLNRTVETPGWMSGAWQVNEVLALTWNRMYIILFCLIVFMALIAIMKRTLLGLQVRAVSQNRTMARAMGVRSDWVDALTFGLGAGIAGIAGVGLSLLTNVGPNLGQAYIIDSFMVVVFGGVGNLWGTLVAGLSLGVANKLLEPWAGAVLAKILVLVFIILFIQKRPKGLFPQRGRAAED